jgi:hypothetical protein
MRSVGIFLAPDGDNPGALENLYLQAIGDDPIIACVRDFRQCVAPHSTLTTASQRAKAEFHAWLSACDEPGILPGFALDQSILDRDSPAFDSIKQFYKDLASAASSA